MFNKKWYKTLFHCHAKIEKKKKTRNYYLRSTTYKALPNSIEKQTHKRKSCVQHLCGICTTNIQLNSNFLYLVYTYVHVANIPILSIASAAEQTSFCLTWSDSPRAVEAPTFRDDNSYLYHILPVPHNSYVRLKI